MARDLRKITAAYWRVRSAVHHPDAPSLTTGEALQLLSSSDMLRPTDWRLTHLMHEVRYDIVEGNTRWRERRQVAGSISTLRMKD